MPRTPRLSASMSVAAFDRGYWYSTALARFATAIGIRSATRLRKNELEQAIRTFLTSGRITSAAGRPPLSGTRDVERGLTMRLRVVVYVNDTETKAFLDREARRLAPGLVRRSGARYRLNRWRERQLARGRRLTYGDLVRQCVRLSQAKAPFARVPHGRYVNFVSDFRALAPGGTFQQAVRAWKQLKRLPIRKDYRAWVTYRASRSR